MLKQFHLFGRGDVADALKSERSQRETLRLHRQGELSPPPTFFYSSLRAKLVEV